MAVLKKHSQDLILREISGNLGDLVIRHVNGKTIISTRPKRPKLPQSPECAAQRNKFAACGKYAGFLNKIPALSVIWKAAKAEGQSVHNKIVKQNYQLIDIDHPGAQNTITPPHFQFRIRDVILFEDNFEIIMEEWFEPQLDDACIIIMALFDPIEPCTEKFTMTNLSPAGSMDFILTLDEDQLRKCAEYKSFIIYIAIYRQKENEVQWSNTVAVKGEID